MDDEYVRRREAKLLWDNQLELDRVTEDRVRNRCEYLPRDTDPASETRRYIHANKAGRHWFCNYHFQHSAIHDETRMDIYRC